MSPKSKSPTRKLVRAIHGESSVTSIIRDFLGRKVNPLSSDDTTHLEAIVAQLFQQAESGNVKALQEIIQRVDGKVADRVQHSVAADGWSTQYAVSDMGKSKAIEPPNEPDMSAQSETNTKRVTDADYQYRPTEIDPEIIPAEYEPIPIKSTDTIEIRADE